MMHRKVLWGVLIVLLTVGCAAPRPVQSITGPATSSTATPTRARSARPTSTAIPAVQATATPVALPTATPQATATATPSPAPTATALPATGVNVPANPSSAVTRTSGVLLPLNPRKYPAPVLLGPDNNATFHVSQPVVHFVWTPAPTELYKFGQTPGCVSDATNYRRAFESYRLVIRSLDSTRPDIVQWNENNTEFYLNLTTVPAGRYAWTVDIVTLCESYVVGQRDKTITRGFVAPVSPASVTRTFAWAP